MSIKVKKYSLNYHIFIHFFGLGNFTPNTLSILAIKFPLGKDLPASQAFTSVFCTHI